MKSFAQWLTHPTFSSVFGFILFAAVVYFVLTKFLIPRMKKDGAWPPRIGKGK